MIGSDAPPEKMIIFRLNQVIFRSKKLEPDLPSVVEHMILSLTLSGVLPEEVIAWCVIPEYLSPHWKSIPGYVNS